jgi:hypothetical protein
MPKAILKAVLLLQIVATGCGDLHESNENFIKGDSVYWDNQKNELWISSRTGDCEVRKLNEDRLEKADCVPIHGQVVPIEGTDLLVGVGNFRKNSQVNEEKSIWLAERRDGSVEYLSAEPLLRSAESVAILRNGSYAVVLSPGYDDEIGHRLDLFSIDPVNKRIRIVDAQRVSFPGYRLAGARLIPNTKHEFALLLTSGRYPDLWKVDAAGRLSHAVPAAPFETEIKFGFETGDVSSNGTYVVVASAVDRSEIARPKLQIQVWSVATGKTVAVVERTAPMVESSYWAMPNLRFTSDTVFRVAWAGGVHEYSITRRATTEEWEVVERKLPIDFGYKSCHLFEQISDRKYLFVEAAENGFSYRFLTAN